MELKSKERKKEGGKRKREKEINEKQRMGTVKSLRKKEIEREKRRKKEKEKKGKKLKKKKVMTREVKGWNDKVGELSFFKLLLSCTRNLLYWGAKASHCNAIVAEHDYC